MRLAERDGVLTRGARIQFCYERRVIGVPLANKLTVAKTPRFCDALSRVIKRGRALLYGSTVRDWVPPELLSDRRRDV